MESDAESEQQSSDTENNFDDGIEDGYFSEPEFRDDESLPDPAVKMFKGQIDETDYFYDTNDNIHDDETQSHKGLWMEDTEYFTKPRAMAANTSLTNLDQIGDKDMTKVSSFRMEQE